MYSNSKLAFHAQSQMPLYLSGAVCSLVFSTSMGTPPTCEMEAHTLPERKYCDRERQKARLSDMDTRGNPSQTA